LGACRALVRYGVGVAAIDVEAATRAGIPVGNVVDASVAEVADHAVALALALLRRIPETASAGAGGGRAGATPAGVRRYAALTVGVLGLGRIGRAVAERF